MVLAAVAQVSEATIRQPSGVQGDGGSSMLFEK